MRPNRGQPACHVTGFARPFDRARGRPRSGDPRSFYEKPLQLFGNQPALEVLSEYFAKSTSDYFEINPASLLPLLSVTLSCKLPQPRSRLSPAALSRAPPSLPPSTLQQPV